ncbi:plant-specific domain TIGR01589 family protein [Zea mays]|uniref:Plant-specific domain TIGR01589 family protein n=1 Tax=Zea mays TaxID=4577 RepID=B6T687_MAIZE|nr:plant-specific domain TIGR01589 family protein [Zea mays]ACG32620.1 plant-specific domain TIGR01589 family protein [Zea mays]|eukprot:NP_001148712.1 plant-specific domain TIGR01589 family protein [Zea mays]
MVMETGDPGKLLRGHSLSRVPPASPFPRLRPQGDLVRAGDERARASGMPGEEDVRKVSREDIQLVQNLIERCLQLYMNQKEVVDTLSFQAKIEPSFTEIVWQRLEEENRDFFKAYYARLMLMNQIVSFNKLLEQQHQIMNKDHHYGMPAMPSTAPNGSNSNMLNQAVPFLPDTIPSTAMQDNLWSNGSSSSIVNGAPSDDQCGYSGKVAHGLPGVMDASSSLLAAHKSTVGQFNGHDGTTTKTESDYSSNSDFGFGNETVFLEQSVGDISGGSFSSSELNGQPVGSSSYGFLSQIPCNFSLSDWTDCFSQSSEIFENYGGSPFIPSDANNIPESSARENTG